VMTREAVGKVFNSLLILVSPPTPLSPIQSNPIRGPILKNADIRPPYLAIGPVP
jgi:hypothetical protein